MADIEAYGLLHLARDEYSAVNVKVRNFSEQIKVYILNAKLLSKSLAAQNIKFTLLTNDKDLLIRSSQGFLEGVNVEQIPINTIVPSGTKFYSAHFKVDAYRHIGNTNIEYAFFCDLDMVCLKSPPLVFRTLIKEKIPLVYDVTDQLIPDYGHEEIIKTFETINGTLSEGRWIGGEFMAGPPQFFKILSNEIEKILPKYFELLKLNLIPSKGNDEVYSSAAIEAIKNKKIRVSDAGSMYIVGRFWSSGTGFIQNKFEYFENNFLLHLPANKEFLAEYAGKDNYFDSKIFIADYKKYLKLMKIKSTHRYIIYFLFAVKEKTFGLKSIKFGKPNT